MLFEDLFYDDTMTAPANLSRVHLNEVGRTLQMEAEYLEGGEVIRWNRMQEPHRAVSPARATGQHAAVVARL